MSAHHRPDLAAAIAAAEDHCPVPADLAVADLAHSVPASEPIAQLSWGCLAGSRGVLVRTDRGLIFVSDRDGHPVLADLPFTAIVGVEWHGGGPLGTLAVLTKDATTLVTDVPAVHGRPLADASRALIEPGGR